MSNEYGSATLKIDLVCSIAIINRSYGKRSSGHHKSSIKKIKNILKNQPENQLREINTKLYLTAGDHKEMSSILADQ